MKIFELTKEMEGFLLITFILFATIYTLVSHANSFEEKTKKGKEKK